MTKANRKRLIVLGVSHPIRGGISHYSTLLVRELRRTYDVKFVTFIRQYPTFLLPGKTQYDDSSQKLLESNDALIDSLNPISWIRVAKLLNHEKPDLVIIHWWHPFFALPFGTITSLLSSALKAKSCFICHNVLPHEKIPFQYLLTRYAFRNTKLFIVHSEEDKRKLLRLKPNADVRINCHPTYSIFGQWQIYDKADARKRLAISDDARTILFFGFVRPYKGLKHLIHALEKIRSKMDCLLLIVGEFFYQDKKSFVKLIEERGLKDHVIIVDKYVRNEDVALYFGSADVVALPYTSATQSGIVQIAFGLNTPVITTDVGGLSEAVEDGKTGFVVKPGNSDELAQAIIKYYKGDYEGKFRKAIKGQSARFGWNEEVTNIESFLLSPDSTG